MEVLSGRYRLIERIGAGGMSVVWRAYDQVLQRQVAVKVLAAELTDDTARREQIRREAQAAAGLSDPHITSVYDYGEQIDPQGSTIPYVVMELVDGVSLATRLAAGPLPWASALQVGAQVATALAAAHARGLVHRDVSAANIMLTDSGVKVVDFGIAAVIGDRGDGVIYGTPAYLAPERRAGGPAVPASDVFALGVVLYQALAGRLPWAGELPEPPLPYPPAAPLPTITGLPAAAYRLIQSCLADEPVARPNCRKLGSRLGELAGLPAPATALRARVALSGVGATAGGAAATAGALAGRAEVVGRTTALPIRSGTQVMPAYQPDRRRPLLPGLAIFTALVLAVLLGVAVITGHPTQPAAAVPSHPAVVAPAHTTAPAAGPTAPGGLACAVAVSHAVRAFGPLAVQLKVINIGAEPFDDWTLQFRVPEHEQVSVTTGRISQRGRVVTVTQYVNRGQLRPGDSFDVSYLGSDSHDGEVSPDRFTLGGVACTTA